VSISPISNSLKVVVVGGGAAGFFGAIAAATNPHTRVVLLEAGRAPLAKVRISGGGRCNVTHACFDPAVFVQNYPRGNKALRGPFSKFQARDTVEWFARRGVELKTEADGRMFPITDDSATIANCLLEAARNTGVEIRTGTPVERARCLLGPQFEIKLKSGEVLQGDRLLLATGSSPQGHRIAKSLGHSIVTPVPSLFTFNLKDERLEGLAGVSVANVRLRLIDKDSGKSSNLEQTGPILVTHWGISGPAVLKLSAWGARFLSDRRYKASLLINWLPQYNPEELRGQLQDMRGKEKKAIANSCPFSLPRRLWESLLRAGAIDSQQRWAELSNKSINRLVGELARGEYEIIGKGVFKEEFVTCGGVSLKEVNFKTMESRLCPGLYFAGEVLDIDGVTGGFNFQSAWTTGWLAGGAINN
jgi:predicted Rossmann fold flavoprotein